VLVVLHLLLILNGRVERPVVLLPHLEKHQLVVVARVVIVLADQEVRMVLVRVGPDTVEPQVQVLPQLLVIVLFMLVTAAAVMLLTEAEAVEARLEPEVQVLLAEVAPVESVNR
jgi:hypothetical protein